MRKKVFTVVMTLLIVGVLALPSVAVAAPPARVTGGGTVDPGALTQFGFSVTGDTGHFQCLMAGLFTAPDPNPAGFMDCPGVIGNSQLESGTITWGRSIPLLAVEIIQDTFSQLNSVQLRLITQI